MGSDGTVAQPEGRLQCPTCGSGMRTRRGSRGDFLGCSRYPECKGTRPISGAPLTPKLEAPGPTGALLTDLRSAAGHIAHAIDILRRRQSELDVLIDEKDGVTF